MQNMSRKLALHLERLTNQGMKTMDTWNPPHPAGAMQALAQSVAVLNTIGLFLDAAKHA